MFEFLRLSRVGVVSTIAIAISSLGIVRAEHVKPANSETFTCSSGTACLTGKATGSEGTGVEGASGATSGHAYGVEGTSSNGDGVYGVYTGSAPYYYGVYSVQGGGPGGTLGIGGPGDGVYAESADTTGLYEALYAVATGKNTEILIASGAYGYCEIDSKANFVCNGSGEAKSLHLQHRTSSGRQVLASGSESTSASLEDAGSARLVAGVADVSLRSAFAATIDPSTYRVFLTPTGDTRGLYVSQKTPGGFQVREAQGGRSTVSFDYRIVARPLDARDDRLAPAPQARLPRRTERSD
jgi:hypothetical protein